MHRHFSTVCSRITAIFAKMLRDHCLPFNAEFVSDKYSLINSRGWMHVMSDVTPHVNMTNLWQLRID